MVVVSSIFVISFFLLFTHLLVLSLPCTGTESSHCKALHLVGPVWMSRESDREYKPTTQQLRAITAGKINRPVRPRRKPVQYNNLVDITESDGEVDLQGSEGAVNSSPERVPRSTQVLRASSVESLWGSSDRSGSLSCWSPESFNRKTATLVHSVEEVKTTQFNRMAKEQGEKGLLEKMMEILITSRIEDQRLEQTRREEDARSREEELGEGRKT